MPFELTPPTVQDFLDAVDSKQGAEALALYYYRLAYNAGDSTRIDPIDDAKALEDIKGIHYARNGALAQVTAYEDIILGGYTQLSELKSALHRLNKDTDTGNENNSKWVSADGLDEYVFRYTNGGFELVTSQLNLGTNNFVGPSSAIMHTIMDVIPWMLFGNSAVDESNYTYWQRFDLFLADGTIDALKGFFTVDPKNTFNGDADNNTLFATSIKDIFDGKAGNDTVSYIDATSGITLNLAAGAGYDNFARDDTFTSIENIQGSRHGDIIVGDALANQIMGLQGNDIIYGQSGFDTLYGGRGFDRIYGGEGDDTISGGRHADVLDGGGGTDTLDFQTSTSGVTVDLVNGTGSGGHAQGDTYTGFERIIGSGFDDVLIGGGMVSSLKGEAGNDSLSATFSGSALSLSGGADTDSLDLTFSTSARLRLLRGDGWVHGDTSTGNTSRVTYLDSSSSASLIEGFLTAAEAGWDTATYGQEYSQKVLFWSTGGATYYHTRDLSISNDFETVNITGSDSNDAILFTGRPGSFDGAGGTGDLFVADWSAHTKAIIWSLDPAVTATPISGVSITGFERLHIRFGSGNDTITADNSFIDGGAGKDILTGNGTLYGGAGSDRLTGSGTMRGGTGNDSYYLGTGGGSVSEFENEGSDTVYTGAASYTLSEHVENLIYQGSANFTGTGNALDNLIIGRTGDDLLIGGQGNDYLEGADGIDTISYGSASGGVNVFLNYGKVTGADGRDTLLSIENVVGSGFGDWLIGNYLANIIHGGDGADLIKANGGLDRLFGEDGDDRIIGGALTDYIEGGNQNDVISGAGGDDELHGNAGNDFIYGNGDADKLYGEAGNDKLTGGKGNDDLFGGAESDRMFGGRGDDYLSGGTGQDYLYGDNGADTLSGGAGNDALTGGKNGDLFIFNRGEGYDKIKDWEVGIDQIDLRDFGLGGSFANVLAIAVDYALGVRLEFADGSMLLFENTAKADLDAGDFML